MRKSRIEVYTNAVARSGTWELARLAANNWHNQGSQLFDNDINTDNKLALVNLAEFGLYSKTLLVDIIRGFVKSV